MSIIIVSKKHLFGDLLASYCRTEGFEIGGLYSDIAEIGSLSGQDMVLYHVDASFSSARQGRVLAFRRQFPGCKIVAIVSDRLSADVIEALSGAFEAVLPNETSTRALAGFLTVVQQGYKITGPGLNSAVETAEPAASQRAPSAGHPVTAQNELMFERYSNGQNTRRSHYDRPQTHDVPPNVEPDADLHDGDHTLRALSIREMEVVELLMKGASNKEIAKRLNIVENTVKVHLRACYGKIGVKNRTQAALWAARNIGG